MFFKRKKELKKMASINSKFKLGDFVNFHYRDDLKFGNVVSIRETETGIVYAIQVGGECPVIIDDISEASIFKN